MSDSTWMVLVIVTGGVLAIMLGRRWYRRRVAAKLADQLLNEVVKSKDGFRR